MGLRWLAVIYSPQNTTIGRIQIESVLNQAEVRIGLLWLVGVRYAQSTEEFIKICKRLVWKKSSSVYFEQYFECVIAKCVGNCMVQIRNRKYVINVSLFCPT
jgi:hypothetical protein